MKSFFKFIVFVGILAAAVYFGYPYAKQYLDEQAASKKPAVEKPGSGAIEPPKKPKPGVAGKATGKPEPEPAPKKPAKAPPSEIEKAVIELYPMPEFLPLLQLVNNWKFIPERAFPRDLTIHAPVDFNLERDGTVIGKRTVPAGSVVVAKGINESNVTISPEGSDLLVAMVDIDQTSLKESIEEGYAIFKKRTEERVLGLREAERKRIARLQAEERYRPVGWSDGGADVFEPMRVSLRNGELEDRLLEDAKRWRWLGKETVNGVTYDAGLVVTEVETIFGVFSKEIKALIRNGRVEKWVDPVSGEEY